MTIIGKQIAHGRLILTIQNIFYKRLKMPALFQNNIALAENIAPSHDFTNHW